MGQRLLRQHQVPARRAVVDQQQPADQTPHRTVHALAGRVVGELRDQRIDMEDAQHPQTILAYGLNDVALPVANGAPIRVRIERQLGYKMAKYIMRIELVESFAPIRGGRGGYWEDQGYQWYAGI